MAGVENWEQEDIKVSPRVNSCPGRDRLRAAARSHRGLNQEQKYIGLECDKRWEPREGMSHMEQPNAQGQSRGGARSKQVMIVQA